MKQILIMAFMALTLFSCSKKKPADHLVASDGKWNFSANSTSKKNGDLTSTNLSVGTMVFSSNGSVILTVTGNTPQALLWTATETIITLGESNDIIPLTIIESTSKSMKFFNETIETINGDIISNRLEFNLTR